MNLSQSKAVVDPTASGPDFPLSLFLQKVRTLSSASTISQDFEEYRQKLSLSLRYSAPPDDEVISALLKRVQSKR